MFGRNFHDVVVLAPALLTSISTFGHSFIQLWVSAFLVTGSRSRVCTLSPSQLSLSLDIAFGRTSNEKEDRKTNEMGELYRFLKTIDKKKKKAKDSLKSWFFILFCHNHQ